MALSTSRKRVHRSNGDGSIPLRSVLCPCRLMDGRLPSKQVCVGSTPARDVVSASVAQLDSATVS